MIDLHMHTLYSDGTDNVIDILKKAQKHELSVISITDHNTCGAYNELKTIDIKKYYSGTIIKGIELNTKILGIPIEILGYGVDTDKMNEITEKKYPKADERNKIEMERIYKICQEKNIDIGENVLENYDSNMYTSKYLHSLLIKNKKNKELIDEESWGNSNIFYRKYMSNPSSLFYINMDDILPTFEEAVSFVKQAGGMVFVPHIFEYRENSIKILDAILEKNIIDGLECYYTTFTKEQHEYILNRAKENNLLISGGSDYHGTFKPDVEMAVGFGNLSIPEEITKNWLDLVEKLT
ncbi:MAG: PHP domain-containing protein [Clostridia bacterium]|nr:PHP domain-containing protein [Clostridia bacterium]